MLDKNLMEITAEMLFDSEKEVLIEMANLGKNRTKLPINVWIDEVGTNRNVPHNEPRLKIQNNYNEKSSEDLIPVSISKTRPQILDGECEIANKDLKVVYKWIKENYDLLMSHWNGEIDTDDLKKELNKQGKYRL